MKKTSRFNKFWFEKKKYGWGWTPISWEGWMTIAIFAGFNTWSYFELASSSTSFAGTMFVYVIWLGVSTFGLIKLCVWKCRKD